MDGVLRVVLLDVVICEEICMISRKSLTDVECGVPWAVCGSQA